MPKKKQKSGNEIPQWVVTYGDMMSLLLCFFILLAAFSELKDPDEFRKVLEKIQEALGFQGGMGQAEIRDSATNSTVSQLEEIMDRADDQLFMGEQNQQNVVGMHDQVSVVHDGNYHAIGGSLPFGAGRTELALAVKRTLRDEVAPKIRDRYNVVRIVGHSWGVQDTTAGDHTHVAFTRARAVQDYLIEECGIDPAILRIEIAADREPARAGPDAAAQNRRVQVYMTDRTIDQVHPDPFGTRPGDE
jgi:chemotaxis protein MotB